MLLEVALAEICLLPRSADLAEWIRAIPVGPPDPAARGSAATGATGESALAPGPSPAGREEPDRTAGAESGPQQAVRKGTEPAGEWERVVDRVRRRKPALAASLAGSQMVGEKEGYLLIRLPAGGARFGSAALELPVNRPVLQEAIREVFGAGLGWRVEPTPAASAGDRRGGEAQPSPPGARSNLADVQRIADRLDGEILGPS